MERPGWIGMFIFGHLGYGSTLAGSWAFNRAFPWIAFWTGCLLPDMIDKPLYYLGAEALPWVTGTRTVGHSLSVELVLALILGVDLKKRKWAKAVFAGVATHILLDMLNDLLQSWLGSGGQDWFPIGASRQWGAVLFPFLGWNYFPIYPFRDGVREHLGVQFSWSRMIIEVSGLFLFIHFWRRSIKLNK